MALLDFLTPKWKHSDIEIKTAAIEKIHNEKTLVEIIKASISEPENYDNVKIIRLALKNINSQNTLFDLLKTRITTFYNDDEHLSLFDDRILNSIANAINNVEILKQLAVSNLSFSIRLNALIKIDDDEFIFNFLKHNSRFNLNYIVEHGKLSQKALFNLAKNHDSTDIWKLAAKRLKDSSQLPDLRQFYSLDVTIERQWGNVIKCVYEGFCNEKTKDRMLTFFKSTKNKQDKEDIDFNINIIHHELVNIYKGVAIMTGKTSVDTSVAVDLVNDGELQFNDDNEIKYCSSKYSKFRWAGGDKIVRGGEIIVRELYPSVKDNKYHLIIKSCAK